MYDLRYALYTVALAVPAQKNLKKRSPMEEASPSGVAPRSPWRARSVTPPASARAPPNARRAHCPDPPAHDERGARGARTSPPSSSILAFLGAVHTFMHTARHCDPAACASARRRVQQPMARPSRAPATQTRTPTRCAARNRRRRASPPPPACFRSFAATPRSPNSAAPRVVF
jgi:hypothetical protein